MYKEEELRLNSLGYAILKALRWIVEHIKAPHGRCKHGRPVKFGYLTWNYNCDECIAEALLKGAKEVEEREKARRSTKEQEQRELAKAIVDELIGRP